MAGNPNWKRGGPSPNKAGRPRGIVDKRMRLSKALMDDAEGILNIVKARAADGDMQAAGLLLARVMPALKAQGERVQFEFDATKPLATQLEQILQSVADGLVSVDIASQIIAAATALAGVRAAENGGTDDKEMALVQAFREFATKVTV